MAPHCYLRATRAVRSGIPASAMHTSTEIAGSRLRGIRRHPLPILGLCALTVLSLLGCGPSRALALREQYRLARQPPFRELVLPQTPPERVLSGEAVVAAHAALRFLQENVLAGETKGCAASPRAFDVALWRAEDGKGWLVNIEQREDRCGQPGGPNLASYDWWELYLVSDEGVVLARDGHPDNAGPPLGPSGAQETAPHGEAAPGDPEK